MKTSGAVADFVVAAEKLAQLLADASRVEMAWALRGLSDGLAAELTGVHTEPENGTYASAYRKGLALAEKLGDMP